MKAEIRLDGFYECHGYIKDDWDKPQPYTLLLAFYKSGFCFFEQIEGFQKITELQKIKAVFEVKNKEHISRKTTKFETSGTQVKLVFYDPKDLANEVLIGRTDAAVEVSGEILTDKLILNYFHCGLNRWDELENRAMAEGLKFNFIRVFLQTK